MKNFRKKYLAIKVKPTAHVVAVIVMKSEFLPDMFLLYEYRLLLHSSMIKQGAFWS